ncbi:uncharacterized protein LOC132611474 [Lycium barbarum]|uniref:uncharacterized protein LOC132611474 n=1 Tax=Lycium barbarum TaxID=112863 RepID=UPI00293E82C3|nr:uncharacterized protein LOC132611474 [Lycium barbarum]XP_060181881.1 uncharacterized protein LOC132611474 [Lycium barbarum]
MGKSLPSPNRIQDFASRIISSNRIPTRIKAPPSRIRSKAVVNGGESSSEQRLLKKSKNIMEEVGSNSNSSTSRRVPLADVVADCVKRWFQDTLKEAKAGDTSMQVLVGQMYFSGYGISRDAHKGRAWISRASKSRSSAWKVSDKRPGYNASDSDSDDTVGDAKQN